MNNNRGSLIVYCCIWFVVGRELKAFSLCSFSISEACKYTCANKQQIEGWWYNKEDHEDGRIQLQLWVLFEKREDKEVKCEWIASSIAESIQYWCCWIQCKLYS